jgi:hypothetical protein
MTSGNCHEIWPCYGWAGDDASARLNAIEIRSIDLSILTARVRRGLSPTFPG